MRRVGQYGLYYPDNEPGFKMQTSQYYQRVELLAVRIDKNGLFQPLLYFLIPIAFLHVSTLISSSSGLKTCTVSAFIFCCIAGGIGFFKQVYGIALVLLIDETPILTPMVKLLSSQAN